VNVLDKTYDKITDLTEVINNYAKGLTTKEQTVEIVEEKINEELLA